MSVPWQKGSRPEVVPGSVLIVEDQESIRSAVKEFLQSEGYQVFEAEHGQHALEVLGSIRPSVILLDMMMPVMDGAEFLKVRQAEPVLQDIPVVVVSANPPPPEGAVEAILQKPFDLDELLQAVERFCRR